MKRFLLAFAVVAAFVPGVTATDAAAQDGDLSSKMELFKDYCLRVRKGLENRDAGELESCLEEFDAEKFAKGEFRYKSSKIVLTEMSELSLRDSSQLAPLVGHRKFDPAYVDKTVAAEFQDVEVIAPELLRDIYDCQYTQLALRSGGKCILYGSGNERLEVFAVTEPGGLVALTVNEEKTGRQVTERGGDVQAVMSVDGKYEVALENLSGRDISLIIVKN